MIPAGERRLLAVDLEVERAARARIDGALAGEVQLSESKREALHVERGLHPLGGELELERHALRLLKRRSVADRRVAAVELRFDLHLVAESSRYFRLERHRIGRRELRRQ